MRILPINIQSSDSKRATLNSDYCKRSQGFKARLRVHNSANKVGLSKLGKYKWDTIIAVFEDKLSKDPIKPYDLVHLRASNFNKNVKSVYTGKSRKVPFQYSSYSTQRRENYQTAYRDEPIYELEDLELSINKSREGFMLNKNCSMYEIADDLYNTYKRVRYLEHFSK